MSNRGSAINGMSHRDLKITRVDCYCVQSLTIRGMILQETWWLQAWWFLFSWDTLPIIAVLCLLRVYPYVSL